MTSILIVFLFIVTFVGITAWKAAMPKTMKRAAAACLFGVGSALCPIFIPAAHAQEQYRLPPIDRKDSNRCTFSSSAMGQANAARDKLYDLRECDMKGQDGSGKDMSGLIGSQADFSGDNFKDAQMSKAYLKDSKFKNADFTNAVLDRVTFDGSDLSGAILKNAVLSGSTFTGANLENTDFSDAYLGPFDLKNLCANPTLKGTNPVTKEETSASAGCLQD